MIQNNTYLIILFCLSSLLANWTEVKFPENSSIVVSNSYEFDAQGNIYAVMRSNEDVKLWKSTDNGESWKVLLDDVKGFEKKVYVYNEKILFCGSEMSQDGGKTWAPLGKAGEVDNVEIDKIRYPFLMVNKQLYTDRVGWPSLMVFETGSSPLKYSQTFKLEETFSNVTSIRPYKDKIFILATGFHVYDTGTKKVTELLGLKNREGFDILSDGAILLLNDRSFEKSTDLGKTWKRILSFPNTLGEWTNGFLVINDKSYAIQTDLGLMLTVNDGKEWKNLTENKYWDLQELKYANNSIYGVLLKDKKMFRYQLPTAINHTVNAKKNYSYTFKQNKLTVNEPLLTLSIYKSNGVKLQHYQYAKVQPVQMNLQNYTPGVYYIRSTFVKNSEKQNHIFYVVVK